MKLKFVDKKHVYLDGERLSRKRGQYVDFARDIYYNDKYMVKIDFSNDQCLVEWNKWNSFCDNHRRFFVPILSFGKIRNGEYVVMEKKKFKKSPNPLKHKDVVDFLEILEFYDLRWDTDIDMYDGTMINCGITTDNKIVCYDYGRMMR